MASIVLDTLRDKQAALLEEKASAEASLKEAETKCADNKTSLDGINAAIDEIEAALAAFAKGKA